MLWDDRADTDTRCFHVDSVFWRNKSINVVLTMVFCEGEIACTYASGCCTAEQAVLIAYHRGRLPTEHKITTGLMAATGLSADEARARCEGTNVVLACDNSPNSTTISGRQMALICRSTMTFQEAPGANQLMNEFVRIVHSWHLSPSVIMFLDDTDTTYIWLGSVKAIFRCHINFSRCHIWMFSNIHIDLKHSNIVQFFKSYWL